MARRALLVFLAATAIGGCGEHAAAPKPDRVVIQQRVAAYVRHLLAGDGVMACAQLTPRYRGGSERAGANSAASISCAEAA